MNQLDGGVIELAEVRLVVVTPMANEETTAVRFVSEVLDLCQGFQSVVFLAVLDHSGKDETRRILEEFGRREPRLRVVWAPENRCVVDAYVRGYREALDTEADWILEMDAGFSHQPGDIPPFFEQMRKGYDCVFGSRFMKGGSMMDSPAKRYLVSYGGTLVTNLLLGTRLTDMTSGFELFSRRALEAVLRRGIQSRAHFFQTEIKAYCRDLRIKEIPITYRNPSSDPGASALADAFGQLWRLWKLRLAGQL